MIVHLYQNITAKMKVRHPWQLKKIKFLGAFLVLLAHKTALPIEPTNLSPYSLKSLKFMFSKKATKIDEIFTVDLTLCSKCQIDSEDFVIFKVLLRKHEL